jgi:NADH-quinone oxidoreductase subunit M
MTDLASQNFSLLTILIGLPLLGALALAVVPETEKAAHRGLGTVVALLTFLLSLPLVGADYGSGELLWTQRFDWIPALGASWEVGVDGISLWIVLLTTFLTPIILIASRRGIETRVREFTIAMLVLESAMLGALVATDLLLFFLFWEMMLVPMYLLIGIWGGKRRVYATLKFVIYTMVGSLLMLVGILYLYLKTEPRSFSYQAILALSLTPAEQTWLFVAFGLAFMIKVPVFPFHTWLPDAHTEAPTAGSVVLAGVLLKMGTYGLLRFAIPLFPTAMGDFSPLILVLSVVGITYGAFVSFAQGDLKRLVAYSSVSHLGFVMLGIVAFNQGALEGAILQMVNHGISTGGLFLLVGMLYERRHSREIEDYGGIARVMPGLATCFGIVTMSSIGLPLTNGFVGEFMILSSAFREGLPPLPGAPPTAWPQLMLILTVLGTTGVVFGAVTMLTAVRRVFFGPITDPHNAELGDMTAREWVVMVPVLAFIFVIGLFPNRFLEPMHGSVAKLVSESRPAIREARDRDRMERERVAGADTGVRIAAQGAEGALPSATNPRGASRPPLLLTGGGAR